MSQECMNYNYNYKETSLLQMRSDINDLHLESVTILVFI